MAALISAACPTGCAANAPGTAPNAALLAAAQVATQAADFYNVTLKNLAIPWTNRDQTVFAPLNDYAATVIGMVRDDVPFNTALSADILYTVNSPGLPPPSNASNSHYATAEANGIDLSTTLKRAAPVGDLRHPDCGHRRPAHHLCRGSRLLHQGHQSRHVPFHDDQSLL